MRVNVLFFGVMKEIAEKSGETLELPEASSVRDVLAHYEKEIPRMKPALASLAVAVNKEYAGLETPLQAEDEVALLPPVSGGSAQDKKARASIVRDRIDSAFILENLKCGDDGGVVMFEGVVRNQTGGRKTLYLDYEAYEDMALSQMEALAERAIEQFAVRDVAVVHRLGRMEIGETSVLIVVVSAHRAAAFDACRWLIDTLKKTVPIWKKEYFEDGAVWADGEAFR